MRYEIKDAISDLNEAESLAIAGSTEVLLEYIRNARARLNGVLDEL